MREVFLPRSAWVLSGSIMGWGEDLVEKIDAAVLLTLDPEARMSRLRARERIRFRELAKTGGIDEAAHEAFLSWARGYDDPDSRAGTSADMNSGCQLCPAPSFESTAPGRWTTSCTPLPDRPEVPSRAAAGTTVIVDRNITHRPYLAGPDGAGCINLKDSFCPNSPRRG